VQPWVGALTWNQYKNVGHWKAVDGDVSKVFSLPAVSKKDEKKKSWRKTELEDCETRWGGGGEPWMSWKH
jgi:hypothetical protein